MEQRASILEMIVGRLSDGGEQGIGLHAQVHRCGLDGLSFHSQTDFVKYFFFGLLLVAKIQKEDC
jgi:hypothetical protein